MRYKIKAGKQMNNIYKLENKKGLKIILSSIGAGIVDIIAPDRNGVEESILIHPKNIDEYAYSSCYFGKPTGRTAGRIENGSFEINNQKYEIVKAKGNKHALHGGVDGWAFKEFKVEQKADKEYQYIVFKYYSKDGEGGYPGNLRASISYRLSNEKNVLRVEHHGQTDKDTLLNLTNHAYFNLSGDGKRNILDHILYIDASKFGEVNQDIIATGIKDVDEVYDFKIPHEIGKYIETSECQNNSRGYDNPFIIDQPGEHSVSAFLLDRISGRYIKIKSSYECAVFYSTNYPDPIIVNHGESLKRYDGCCLEFQHFPNGVNSSFLSHKKDVLRKNEKYQEFIEYEFCHE